MTHLIYLYFNRIKIIAATLFFYPSFQIHFLILHIHEILRNINFDIIQFECQFSNENPLIFQIFIYFQHIP